MALRRVLLGSVVLSFLLLLFGLHPEKYLSGHSLYYFSCAPLRSGSSMSSLEVITGNKQVNSTRRLGRHLGCRLRGMSYLGARVNYHHNSTSSFQLIRLIKSNDGQISASTIWNSRHFASNARLHKQASAISGGVWEPSKKNANQWLQIDLVAQLSVTRVATQGRPDGLHWVTKYHLQYSNNGSTFQFHRERGKHFSKVSH